MKAKKAQRRVLWISQPWIIWYAVVLHTVWGCLLLMSPSAYGPTGMHVFHDVPRGLMASILFVASGLAVWAVTRRQPSLRTLAALLPQQALMTFSAYAAVNAAVVGHYGDGVMRPPLFILVDQAPAIIAFILHTAALLEMHTRSRDSDLLWFIRLFREHGPAEAPNGQRPGLTRHMAGAGDGQPNATETSPRPASGAQPAPVTGRRPGKAS